MVHYYVNLKDHSPVITIGNENKIKTHITRPGTEGTRLIDIFKKAIEMAEE